MHKSSDRHSSSKLPNKGMHLHIKCNASGAHENPDSTNHQGVRPEMVELAKNLIEDPDFPTEDQVQSTARSIYNQYFSNGSGKSSESG